jgi:hypothetical protein
MEEPGEQYTVVSAYGILLQNGLMSVYVWVEGV